MAEYRDPAFRQTPPSADREGTVPGGSLLTGEALRDEVYEQIAEILSRHQKFSLDGYKAHAMKRRMASRMRATGLKDPDSYLKILEEDAAERRHLLAALSIHVSSFFRNPSAFRVLARNIIPRLQEAARDKGSKLRFWSIGCAHGEEPYSLALLCQKQQLKQGQMAIIGTDICAAALKIARRGSYQRNRLAEVSPELFSRYFCPCGDEYRLAGEIRREVQFFRHDITTDPPFYRADLILCRNLLIYFSREQQQKIIETLAGALLPGGFLVLGRAETLAPACRSLFQCVNPAERVYRRVEG